MRRLGAVFMVAGFVFVSGCSKDPGSMSKADIEAKLKDTLELRDVALAESPEGGYTGTGNKEDGTKYTISVTQKKEDKSLWYSAVDEKGDLKAGGFRAFSTASRWWQELRVVMVVVLIAGIACYAIWSKRSSRDKASDVQKHQDDKA